MSRTDLEGWLTCTEAEARIWGHERVAGSLHVQRRVFFDVGPVYVTGPTLGEEHRDSRRYVQHYARIWVWGLRLAQQVAPAHVPFGGVWRRVRVSSEHQLVIETLTRLSPSGAEAVLAYVRAWIEVDFAAGARRR